MRQLTAKEIAPRGWLKKQLEIQAAGLVGNLDKVWPDVRDSRWVGGDREGWERVPYWLDGFIPLAFLLRDDHPILDALGYESLTITEDYLSGTGSIDYESDESYVEGSAGKIAHTANHNWRHDFQEIVGNLLAAGLSIEAFRESPHAEWKALPYLLETEQGWTMPEGMPKIPLSFAIVARKLQE